MIKMNTLIGNQFSFPKHHLMRSADVALVKLLALPALTHGALTLNLDINTGSSPNYSGTAITPDVGNYWNSFVTLAASALTLTSVRDSTNSLTTSTITISRNGGGNFSSWDNSGGGGNPHPVGLMRDYLYGATHTITVSNLTAGLYHLFAYAHSDNSGQASTVAGNAANGGGSATTSDVGAYRNIYQTGAQGSAYVKLIGTVGTAGTFVFTAGNYINGFPLQLLSAPVLSGLTNQTIIAGTMAVLRPTITGTPPPTYQWRSNSVSLAGAITSSNAVLTIPAVPAPITPTLTSGALNLFWPADRIGFRLEAQTNSHAVGLNNNWHTIANSTTTNQIVVMLNATVGSVFFRLVYP
jgi:hypothetical protein